MSSNTKGKLTSPLDFARFEFKYILPRNRRNDVESHLQYFVELDPFVRGRPESKYTVRSLYYDDAAYSAFHDKIDGLLHRKKFRIRTYNDEETGAAPYFLEVKGRHNNLVFKHRTPIEKGNWISSRGDELSLGIIENSTPSNVLDQFTFEFFKRRIKPVALINYKRRPYISKYDPNFRITFDEELFCFDATKLFPEDISQAHSIIPGSTVLEVKFAHHIPAWFHRIIQAHNLKRVSISKICSGMEVLDIARDEN